MDQSPRTGMNIRKKHGVTLRKPMQYRDSDVRNRAENKCKDMRFLILVKFWFETFCFIGVT